MSRRKFDAWYYLCRAKNSEQVSLSDEAIAFWSSDGKTLSRKKIHQLLRSGEKIWNKWRKSLPDMQWYNVKGEVFWLPGFVLRVPSSDFKGLNLSNYYLASVDFSNSSFERADLSGVDFRWIPGKPLQHNASLTGCNFRHVKFRCTKFDSLNASESDFSYAEINGAEFNRTNLSGCKFFKTTIAGSFKGTILDKADFDSAYIAASDFVDVNLSAVKRFARAAFYPPLTVDARTIVKSGSLSKTFYRFAGLPDILIKKLQSKRKMKSVRCFISYSAKDESFVKTLQHDLEEHGLETWYAPRDLPIGARTRISLDEAVASSDKLIIVLSKSSIRSRWVEEEIELALEREQKTKKMFLIPVRIDDAVMKSQVGWAAYLRRTRNIGDLSTRHRDSNYFSSISRLLGSVYPISLP